MEIQRWPYRKVINLQELINNFEVVNQLNLTFYSQFYIAYLDYVTNIEHRLSILTN